MNRFSKSLAATFLSVAMLFASVAQAMEIRQFDKMDDKDQDEYVYETVQAAEKVLRDDGRPNDAVKVSKLFTTNLSGDQISIGMTEFERNLALARADDSKHHINHPNDPWLHVEDAMSITLEKNGIKLPDTFFDAMKDFKPKYPPQTTKQQR